MTKFNSSVQNMSNILMILIESIDCFTIIRLRSIFNRINNVVNKHCDPVVGDFKRCSLWSNSSKVRDDYEILSIGITRMETIARIFFVTISATFGDYCLGVKNRRREVIIIGLLSLYLIQIIKNGIVFFNEDMEAVVADSIPLITDNNKQKKLYLLHRFCKY